MSAAALPSLGFFGVSSSSSSVLVSGSSGRPTDFGVSLSVMKMNRMPAAAIMPGIQKHCLQSPVEPMM